MRILFLTPYVPYPPKFGAAVRIFYLARELSKEHRLVFLTYVEENSQGSLDGLREISENIVTVPRRTGSKRWRQLFSLATNRSFQMQDHYSDAMQQALDRIVQQQRVDAIVVEFAQMAGFRFPQSIPLVIDEHNVEYDLVRRMAEEARPLSFRKLFNSLESRKLKAAELKAVRNADMTLATSRRDEELLTDAAPGINTAVISNGVDVDYFQPPKAQKRCPDTAVFVGATHYFPNADGIHFFMNEIFHRILARHPQFRLMIVGGNPSPSIRSYASDNVTITGFVDDVRPYMHEASVFIVPLRMGGGTRFKVVEAMAAGIPVVSTRLGAEGIPAEHSRELMLADKPAEFAESVCTLFEQEELASQLCHAGLAFVRRHFDWPIIGAKLNSALQQVVGSDDVRQE